MAVIKYIMEWICGCGCRRDGGNYYEDFLAAGEVGFLRHGRFAWYSVTDVALALRRASNFALSRAFTEIWTVVIDSPVYLANSTVLIFTVGCPSPYDKRQTIKYTSASEECSSRRSLSKKKLSIEVAAILCKIPL